MRTRVVTKIKSPDSSNFRLWPSIGISTKTALRFLSCRMRLIVNLMKNGCSIKLVSCARSKKWSWQKQTKFFRLRSATR